MRKLLSSAQKVLELDVQLAATHPRRPRDVRELVAGAHSGGVRVEAGQFAVASHEVLVVGARKQVAVEVRRGLVVVAQGAVEDPVVPAVGVVDLEGIRDDIPGVAEVAVLPGDGGAPGQVVLKRDGGCVAGAGARVDLVRERKALAPPRGSCSGSGGRGSAGSPDRSAARS